MISVLDKGHVRLVDHMGTDLSVVRSARVSYNAAWRAGEDKGSDSKLINYLYKNGHTTPFESVVFTFEVKAPIFVIRQWHRHRTWSYNEMSARYTKLKDEFYVPEPKNVGIQSKNSKQSRDIHSNLTDREFEIAYDILNIMETNNLECFKEYELLLKKGCPKELARLVLPMATYTLMFGTVNLHNLFKFLKERLHWGAQWEIQQYAKALLELITPLVPISVEIFKDELNQNDS